MWIPSQHCTMAQGNWRKGTWRVNVIRGMYKYTMVYMCVCVWGGGGWFMMMATHSEWCLLLVLFVEVGEGGYYGPRKLDGSLWLSLYICNNIKTWVGNIIYINFNTKMKNIKYPPPASIEIISNKIYPLGIRFAPYVFLRVLTHVLKAEWSMSHVLF